MAVAEAKSGCSSYEAEYIAATTAACQGVWLARILAEFRGERDRAFTLKIDSESAIQLIKNPVFHDRSKHINVRYHYIRECIEENRVKLKSVGTVEASRHPDEGLGASSIL